MRRLELGLVLALAACAAAPEEQVTGQARAAVKARLIDPGSARFRNSYIVENVNLPGASGHRRVVCGEVSANNRAGARVGFAKFSWSTAGAAPWIDNGAQAGRPGYDAWCADRRS